MLRAAAWFLFLSYGVWAETYPANLPIHHPAIRYLEAAPDDPVSRLQVRINKGGAALEFVDGGPGYLPSVLRLLDIPVDSQALVFSKTSFQAARISPHNPRAIYFNDEVAVGSLRGQGLELASLDPQQGVIFYTLAAGKSERPRFMRSESCLRCHQGPATAGVPGIFVGSVYPGPTGLPDRQGAIITDHRTAFEDRWGGWYVNAKRGQQPDRSNSTAPDPAEPHALASEGRQNLLRLDHFFSATGYLSGVSDIVALMTFEHQTQMINLFTRLGWEWRLGADPIAIDSALDAVSDYMLFTDEAPLKEPIEGVSSFSKTFPEHGPRDRRGRSLREFDLDKRLFRYPLSYMIYSRQFDALPEPLRQELYKRIYRALVREGPNSKLSGLSTECRRSILQIVCDTKPDAPLSWCDGTSASR